MKVSRFRVKFLEVCEWFDGCDRLKMIFKSWKNKITKLNFILKIIKNYHYVSLIYRKKNLKMSKWKYYILIIKYLKDNVIENFVIKNYFLNLTFKQFENFRD